MAIAYGSAGTAGVGTTSIGPTCPATVGVDDLLVLIVANKYPTNGPATPAGWTLWAQFSGGAGSAGIDSGTVYITVFYRVADGTEDGSTVTVSIGSGNSAVGIIHRYTKASTAVWSLAASGGSDNTAGTSWSVTAAADPGFEANDFALAISAINTDARSFTTSPAITAAGATFGAMTQRSGTNTTQGDDCRVEIKDCSVTAGPSSGVPTYSVTASGSSTNEPAGATVIARLREVTFAADLGTASGEGFDGTFSPGDAPWAADLGSASPAGLDATFSPGGVSWLGDLGTAGAAGFDATFSPGNTDWLADLGSGSVAGLDAEFSPSWEADLGSGSAAGFDASYSPGDAPWLADLGSASPAGLDALFSPGPVSWLADLGSASPAGLEALFKYGKFVRTRNDRVVFSASGDNQVVFRVSANNRVWFIFRDEV